MSAHKILGVIPARYASKRFLGKMLVNILGKSLIRRTYENALQSKLLDKVVIATDNQQIFDHVIGFGGEVYMTGECASGSDRAAELVMREFPNAEIVVNVQGDEPCLHPDVIDTLVETLIQKEQAVVATPVTLIQNEEELRSTSIVKCVFNNENKALYFSRSPIPFSIKYDPTQSYYRHIGVYAFRRSFLEIYPFLTTGMLQKSEDLEQLKILEHDYPIYVCPVITETIGVDVPEDLKKVENYLCRNTSLSQEALSLL